MKFKENLLDNSKVLITEVCVIPSTVVTQAVATAGADAIVIDQEHGAIDTNDLHAMIASIAGTSCAPLVRLADRKPDYVKRALDMGAEGIMFPLIKTADDVRECVSMMRYPPAGRRGWGPFIAHSRWGASLMEYAPEFDKKTACIILIETAEAVDNINEICDVEGIDVAFIAKFDLSASLGILGDFGNEKFLNAVYQVEAAIKSKGIPLGGGPVRSKQEMDELCSRGYRLIANFDILRLKGSVSEHISWARQQKI